MVWKKSWSCLGVPSLNGEDACQPYAKGHPIWGASLHHRGGKRTECSGHALNCMGVPLLYGEEA